LARKRLQLRGVLAAAITLLAGVLVAASTLAIGETAVHAVRDEIGRSLALLADQMQDKLDRALYERVREVSNIASLLGQQSQSADELARQTARLETLESAYPEYAWLALVSPDGHVLSSSGGLAVGADISDRPWFKASLTKPVVEDAHGEPETARTNSAGGSQRSRIVEVAAPIVTPDGKTIAVLAAQLGWAWAQEVRDSLFGATAAHRSAEVIVLSRDGAVLLSPPTLDARAHALGTTGGVNSGPSRFAVEDWPDGHRYVTGYAKSDGHRTFQGLGWIVLVRADANIALAPVSNLTRDIIVLGFFSVALAAAAAWMLAGRMAAPMLMLAAAAEKIRDGRATGIPEVGTYAEAETLAQSLRVLVSELHHRQRALAELNASLEDQISERTRRLADQNAALEAAKIEAEQATEAKSLFLAAASHDLRQPLHAMTLFSRALSRRISGTEATRLLSQLEECLASLREMFDALLNVSRLDAGLISAETCPISLASLVERLSIGFKADAEHRGLRYSGRSVDVVVLSDPVILETILRNLVSNALKFTREGGVLLAARRRAGGVSIEIYDTGPGIPKDKYDRIFREFERSQDQAVGPNEGLGLGLSIVRRYAGLLGVRVALRSRVGHGSRFSITIPESKVSAVARSLDKEQPRAPANLAGLRILVLDDEPAIVSALTRELEDRGAVAQGFLSAKEAENAIAEGFEPDAAVVDFDLRCAERGHAAARRLAGRLGRPLPFLVLSGATDRETLKELAASGVAWLTKPADPDAIAAEIFGLCALAAPSSPPILLKQASG
jgi:signal transduction histidine kinase/ActR/RegA family two-component response regulator